MYTYKVI